MRGRVTHWGDHAAYGFVTGEDGREYVLRDDEFPAWMHNRKPSAVGKMANAMRVGLVVEFDAVDIGSRKLSCKNVFVIGPVGPNDPLRG